MKEEEFDLLRKSFPVFKEYTYLHTNAGAPISNQFVKSAIAKLNDYAESGRIAVNKWQDEVEETRAKIAGILNCNTEELAFINSVSIGMNLLTGLFPNDHEIISFKDDFPTSFVNWLHNGYQLELINSRKGKISIIDIENAIRQNKKAKVLIASHVMYKTGYCFDLIELGKLAEKYNLIFIVDATQSFGVKTIDVRKMNIDILLFHGYKWITAGYGIGAMYVSKKILNSFRPKQIGWDSVDYEQENFYEVEDFTKFRLKKTAKVFEGGNNNFLSISLLNGVLDNFINGRIKLYENYISELVIYFHSECLKNGITIESRFENKHLSGIQRIRIDERDYKNLREKKIIARFVDGILTIALSFYNNKNDINKLISAIKEVKTATNKG